MNCSRLLPILAALTLSPVLHDARADDPTFKAPDSIVLKDGRVVHGLVIKNTRDAVLLQEDYDEVSYPKKDIIRIIDHGDAQTLYTDVERKGTLPSWRILANDLRTIDAIKSLEEIPATVIDNGEFRNVPYLSFRVNKNVELDIYGDPANPAGIELGIYGSKSGDIKLRDLLRSYLAGYLTSRQEIAALYSLDINRGIAQAGNLTFEITPKDAPDAYGAWWISVYNKAALNAARLTDAEYAKLARPVNQVENANGELIAGDWTPQQVRISEKVSESGKSPEVLLRGFYRDKDGKFRLITGP